MPSLAAQIPLRHPAARLVRFVAKRTATPGKLAVWVKEHIDEYGVLTARIARCRDSWTHGGPVNHATAASVKKLAWAEAKRTTHSALWAVVAGKDPHQEHQLHHKAEEQWRASLAGLGAAADAFR